MAIGSWRGGSRDADKALRRISVLGQRILQEFPGRANSCFISAQHFGKQNDLSRDLCTLISLTIINRNNSPSRRWA